MSESRSECGSSYAVVTVRRESRAHVHLLFLDESGRLDQGGLFALGGIAVRDTDWPELRDRWQAALSEVRWPLDREVKRHGIRKGEVPDALADAVFETLAGSRSPAT